MTDRAQASRHYQVTVPHYEIVMPDGSPPTVEVLHLALNDENAEIAVRAALQLTQLGDLSPAVMNTLFNASHWTSDPEASSYARHGIVELAKSQPVIIDLLLAALQQGHRRLTGVAECLGAIGQATPEVIGGLLTFVRQNQQVDTYAAVSAARSLLQLGYEDAALVDFLQAVRRRGDAFISSVAVEALGLVKEPMPELVEGLLTTLKRGDTLARASAAKSLGHTAAGTPQVIEALCQACQDKEWEVRAAAIHSLGAATDPTPALLDILVAALSDREWFVRLHALESLGNLGQATPIVLDRLLAALESEEQQQRARSASQFDTDEQNDDVRTILTRIQNSQSLRGNIAITLAQLGCVNEAVVAAFLDELGSKDASIRERAARNWWLLGNTEPGVVQALQQALHDEAELVRTSAANSLERLQSESASEQDGRQT